jgi:hypothetical protein
VTEERTTAGAGAPGRPVLVGGYRGLSGNSYVVGEPDAAGTGADGEPVPRPACAAIPVRSPRRAGAGYGYCRYHGVTPVTRAAGTAGPGNDAGAGPVPVPGRDGR